MIVRLTILIIAIVSFTVLAQAEQQNYRSLEVVDFKSALESNEFDGTNYAILDVRPKLIFHIEHIEGAISIPRAELDVRHNELNHLTEYILYIYGYNSTDASRAAIFLAETKDFTDIIFLEEGIDAWKSKNYILVK